MLLGDLVTTRKTCSPTMGYIAGIMSAAIWLEFTKAPPEKRWTEIYPDWLDKPVILIQLKKPHKGLSLSEYRKSLEEDVPNIPLEHAKILYKYLIPTTNFISCPIDDVEFISDFDDF
jgi:hypothetical protein